MYQIYLNIRPDPARDSPPAISFPVKATPGQRERERVID